MTTHPATPDQSNPVGKTPALPKVVSTAPKRIWLDLGFDPTLEDAAFSELHEITWSSDNASGHGVEYVRADLATRNMDSTAGVQAQAGAESYPPSYGATEFGWEIFPPLQEGDKRLMALVVSLYGNDHQAFEDLEALVARADTAALHALRARGAVPSGWVLVPRERSYDQRAKALIAFNTTEARKGCDRDDALQAAWEAMLAAAPAAPGSVVEQDAAPTVQRMAEVMSAMLEAVTTQDYQDAADDAKELVAQVKAAKGQESAA